MHTVTRATLSGSFHKDSSGLERAYDELVRNQCQVLSPHRLDFIDHSTLFVRHETEKNDTILEIEKHHLRAISQSDFLWVHAPEGYIGTSAALEIGYALAHNIPIFSSTKVINQTLSQFVRLVPSVFAALTIIEHT